MSKKRASVFGSVKKLTLAAMLCAMSVVIGIFCKNFLDFGNGLFRVTFENLPIIIAGIFLGPIAGGAVGASSDLISYLLSTKAYPPNLIVTLGATMIGVVCGVVSKYVIKKDGYGKIIASGALAHIIGSMIIKPIGLFQFYSWGVLFRIPMYIVIAPLEIFLICLLYKNKPFRSMLENMGLNEKKKREKMTYEKALEYIHSVSWKGSRPGLERTRTLMEKLGNVQDKLRFIHVAGTNGKGSFCAMLTSILIKSGYKVGTYTSPYVLRFNERMKINGVDISDETLAQITEYVKPFADSMEDSPTEFELITAIALEYFYREGCDIVILECGMGGRLDSTNIIKTPVLSVITGISLDHTSFLGNTVYQIAEEKAGIIKENTPVLFCSNAPEAECVIRAKAHEMCAPYYTVDRSSFVPKSMTLGGAMFDFAEYENLEISLLGTYQPHNACNVIRAVELLETQGMAIPKEAVYSGLRDVSWHARFERLCAEPCIIFDGGHNPEGVDAAVESIKSYFSDKKVCIITGVMADKDYKYMAKRMSEVACRAFCVTPDNPRALNSVDYASVFEELGVYATPCESVKGAVGLAKDHAIKENTAVICLGSLYMYEEIYKALK